MADDAQKAKAPFNISEVQVLRVSRLMQDMSQTEGWKEYEKILQAQIADRLRILAQPLHTLPNDLGLDFLGRAAQLESVKGAIIALEFGR